MRYALLASLALTGLLATPSRGDLVVNGGFETGSFDPLVDWTPQQPHDQYLFVAQSQVSGYGLSHSGNYFAILAGFTVPFDTITQSIATQAGEQYSFSFWLRTNGDTSSHADEFKASFGSQLVLDDLSRAASDWTQYSYVVTATSSSTTLKFSGAIGNTFWALDDVSVTPSAVPEPASLLMLGTGVVALLGHARRRRRSAA